ncbi:rhamnan synthesis F family protein [Sphingobium xenophagum]|uniref:rhamnan synthesis F family protein n=2 Tax=Sphingobium xenophagum TaxID=121428 RepID=UPI0036D2E94C
MIDNLHISILREWEYFDADWYLQEYPDVRILNMDPAYHYLWIGARMGRKPSALFDNFINRYHKADDLIREIKKAPSPGRQSPYASHDDPLRKQPAEFIEPGSVEPAAVEGLRVAVHAHIYYADLAEEFARYLCRIPCTFDLYASTATEEARRNVAATFSNISNVNNVDVRVVPNIGRDIAPLFVEFGDDLIKYDIISHIHTKKSFYNNGSTDGWREYILESLFENEEKIAFFIQNLNRSRYGIIYPQSFHNLPYMAATWLANGGLARKWAPQFGVNALPDGYFDFPIGSMFWAKTDAIRPLLDAGLQWSDFPPEQGQTDGTLAHCIERMLGVVPTSRHFQHGVIRDIQTPSWSRWRLNQFIDRPLEHIHAAITDKNTKIVAFDIFDTLLTRPFLDADYVKHILHSEHEKKDIGGFRDLRMRSEGEAREAKGSDVDIHDIYRQLSTAESATQYLTPDREIALEMQSVRTRSEVVALLNLAVQSGKKVVLASDMFLPRSAIEAMLARCGIAGWDRFYLSSEVGLRKDSGKLYEHILAMEGVKPHQMVMIGDNERSDFQIPANMGIRTIHLLKPVNIMRAIPRLTDLVPAAEDAPAADQFLFGAIASENFGAISYPDFSPDDMFGPSPRAIGYSLLGPIAAAFSQWLLDEAQKHGLDQLYFLAREGKFLKAAFDVWQDGRAEAVRSDYLLISRRAVTVPCIRSVEDIFDIAASNDFHGASMAMFLNERFGTVLDDVLWTECARAKLWPRHAPLMISNGDIDHIRPFLRFIAPHIIRQADIERESALAYYHAQGLGAGESAAVVDVGYGATIQRHLIRLLDQKIHGLYMITDKKGDALGAAANVIASGCFVQGAERNPSASPLFVHSFLLEKMLSADDEQVIRYNLSGQAEFRERGDYIDSSQKVRHELQQGAMAFLKDAVRFRDEMMEELIIDTEKCETLFSRFVSDISDAEKRIFSSLALDDYYCGRGIVE